MSLYGLKEDDVRNDVRNDDNRIGSDMTKLSNLINNGIKIQMPDIIITICKHKFERNNAVINASNLKEAKKCYISKDMKQKNGKDTKNN